ncbi:MAG: LamG-like jellyroll fold domain-containing protein [Microcystaceae cyanobacterium]
MSLSRRLFLLFGFIVGSWLIIILFDPWNTFTSTIPLNGLKLWLKSDVGVITSIEGTISEWVDQSENDIKVSMIKEERQPLLVENALNNYPVVQFNGQQSLSLSPFLSPTQFTLFIVGKNSNPNESFSMILGPGGKSPNNQLRWENGSNALFVGTSNRFPITTSPIGDTRIYHILSAHYDGSTMTVYRDGVPVSTHEFSTNGPWVLGQIGAWYSRYFMIGELAEIMVYDVVLTEKELTSVTSYLQDKYDLTP